MTAPISTFISDRPSNPNFTPTPTPPPALALHSFNSDHSSPLLDLDKCGFPANSRYSAWPLRFSALQWSWPVYVRVCMCDVCISNLILLRTYILFICIEIKWDWCLLEFQNDLTMTHLHSLSHSLTFFLDGPVNVKVNIMLRSISRIDDLNMVSGWPLLFARTVGGNKNYTLLIVCLGAHPTCPACNHILLSTTCYRHSSLPTLSSFIRGHYCVSNFVMRIENDSNDHSFLDCPKWREHYYSVSNWTGKHLRTIS